MSDNEDLKDIIRNSNYANKKYNLGYNTGLPIGFLWGIGFTVVIIGLGLFFR